MTAMTRRVVALLEEGVRDGIFPAAAVWVGDADRELLNLTVGNANLTSLFDLASLTKPMAVASLAMTAVADGALSLDDTIGPDDLSLAMLLGHRGGFPAHLRFPSSLDRSEAQALVWQSRRNTSECVYTDLGYMALGWFLESRLGQPLNRAVQAVTRARFGPDIDDPSRCLPTGYSPLRGVVARGEVHDDNCWVLGGVAGHAGLFGTAADVGSWAQDLLRAYLGSSESTFEGDVVRRFWSLDARPDEASWVLGFDTPTPPKSSAGHHISPNAVGHLGFTGTSVWIDPNRRRTVILLTNRVASTAGHSGIKRFRPRLHNAILQQ